MLNHVPTGDKEFPFERDDMLNPQNTSRSAVFEHLQRYKYAAKKCKGKILDLGCGTGYGSKILFDKGSEVYAIDNSKEAIGYAKKNYSGPKYHCNSAEQLPFEDNFFDAVCAFEVIEHIKDPEAVLNEAHRVLKRNGDLFISTPNPRHLRNVILHILFRRPYPKKSDPNNIYHLKEFYYDEFIGFLQNNKFKIIDKFGQTLPIFPGLRILDKFPFFYKIPVLLGHFFPKYSITVVVHAKK